MWASFCFHIDSFLTKNANKKKIIKLGKVTIVKLMISSIL